MTFKTVLGREKRL